MWLMMAMYVSCIDCKLLPQFLVPVVNPTQQ